MSALSFGETGGYRVFRPMIDIYRLDAEVAAWTLVAPCEGAYQRLLLTGTVGLPVRLDGDPLRCTSIDSPYPVELDGQQGSLHAQSSDLKLFGRERGFASIFGTVMTQWTALPPGVLPSRPFTIDLNFVARIRL